MPALAVHVEDRRRLALVDREAVRDDLFGVVGAALLLRAQRQARDALLAGHAQLDDGVEALAAPVEERVEVARPGRGCAGSRRAGSRPRRPPATRRSRTIVAGQLVGDEVAGLDDRLDLLAELACRPRRSRGRRRRSRRRDAEGLRDADALGALAGALGTDDQQRADGGGCVIGEVLRSGAAAAARRSASPSRDRHRR